MSQRLQVIIASGPKEPKRAILGLSMAASAAAGGCTVDVYLVMDGALWLAEERCRATAVAGYPPPWELMEVIRETGGQIEYCAHCVQYACQSRHDDGRGCGCASSAGIAAYGLRMPDIHTVVF